MIRYDHYTDKFVKVSDRECPWCKAVCASTDKYCHECGWHIADTPQNERSEQMSKYDRNSHDVYAYDRNSHDVYAVKRLGDEIGYGHLMALAHELWAWHLEEKGLPREGAYCAVGYSEVKDEYQADAMNDPIYKVIVESALADTPQTDCDTCRHYKLACELFSEVCKYEPTTQTETQNSNLTFEIDTPQTGKTCDNCGTPRDKCVYCIEEDRMWTPQTDCGWGEPNE